MTWGAKQILDEPGKTYVSVLNRFTQNEESEIVTENIGNYSEFGLDDEMSRFLCKPNLQPASSKVVKINSTRIEK